jgi:hypothetical protein
MLINQLRELHLVSLHECCDLAQQWLIPPHKGGTIEIWEAPRGNAIFEPVPYWSWVSWGGNAIPITHCPFCGQELSLTEEEINLGNIDFGRIQE